MASDANVTITEGHGGTYQQIKLLSKNWNGTVHYGIQMLLYTLMRGVQEIRLRILQM